jgi:hypothetical protein
MAKSKFLTPYNAALVADIVQYHDATCRQDLATGCIVSERDYVSALSTHLRYPHGSIKAKPSLPAVVTKPKYKLAFDSRTLPFDDEKRLGCDGVILLSGVPEGEGDIHYKVGLFEAKWPRMFGGAKASGATSKGYQPWDKLDSKGESHFSTQLIRQSGIGGSGICIWEQFFSEEPIGMNSIKQFDRIGSTCVMHRDALNHMYTTHKLNPAMKPVRNTSWGRRDIKALLASYPTYSLREVIHKMALCHEGELFVAAGKNIVIPIAPTQLEGFPRQPIDNTSSISIPILNSTEDNDDVFRFMRSNGLKFYTHINFSDERLRKRKLKRIIRNINEQENNL